MNARTRTTWLAPGLAMGAARGGVRGWFLLGERPADGGAKPMIAWGRIEQEGGVIIERGALTDDQRALLQPFADTPPGTCDRARSLRREAHQDSQRQHADFHLNRVAFYLCAALGFAREATPWNLITAGEYLEQARATIAGNLDTLDDVHARAQQLLAAVRATIYNDAGRAAEAYHFAQFKEREREKRRRRVAVKRAGAA